MDRSPDALAHRRAESHVHKDTEPPHRGNGPAGRSRIAVLHIPDSACDDREQAQPSAHIVPPRSAVAQDKELVERAAHRVREILGETMQRGLEEVGHYLFREFYHSNAALYHSTHPNKHVSLRLLMDRTESLELPVTKVFLARAIKMAVLQGQLPRHSRFMLLPSSHRLELLRVKSPERIDQLATRAFDGKISVVKLRDLVRREVTRNKSTRGRKPVPDVIKSLRVCVRQVRDDDPARLTFLREEIRGLSGQQMAEAQALIGRLVRRVDELLRLLP